MKRRGFTVVELIITITIMGILLTLAVVNLSSSQANARDSERKGDAEAIATHMETYYNNVTSDSTTTGFYGSGGTYMGTIDINATDLAANLPEMDPKSLRAPGVSTASPISLVIATNNVQSPAGITPIPTKTNDVYVYQPIAKDASLCTNPALALPDCRKFNLYYYQETTNTVQMITSKNQ